MSARSISDTEIEDDPPTMLDSSSASEFVSNADEVISISDAEDCQPHARGGVEYWQSRCNRFRVIWHELRLDPSFTFELSSESIADNFDAQINHARNVIHGLLEEGYIQRFKVGLTYLPKDRYYSSRYG